MPALHPRRFLIAQSSVLVSFALHLGAILVLAALLQPVGFWQKRPLELEVSIAEPVPEPELLVVSEAPLPVNSGELLVLQESDVFAEAGENTDYFSPDPLLPGGRNGSGAAPAPKQGSGHGASFFGTVAYGDEFVYVVDISTSMDRGQGASASEGTRFVRAMAELRASIERLSPQQTFYVVLFNGETLRMFDDRSVFPQALPATAANKRRLYDWLATISTGPCTDPREALQVGLGMRPSALFLLSDGEFNGQQNRNHAGLLRGNPSVSAVIDRHNRGRTPIHTIAFEDKSCCLALEQIARSTGGEYQFVAPHASAAQPPQPAVAQPAVAQAAVAQARAAQLKAANLAANRADYLLSRASKLETLGRWKQALAMYRRIERDYPATDAAASAAKKTLEVSASGP
ncbi:MAG TPA: hypothetical protein VF278_00720 [Pirellulales bacterium]